MTPTSRRLGTLVFSIGLSIVVVACVAEDNTRNEAFVVCQDPRPEICTMNYDPVCGVREEEGKETFETYSNGCSACSHGEVRGYRPGACEADGAAQAGKIRL